MTEREIFNNPLLLKIEGTLLDVAWSSAGDKDQEITRRRVIRKLFEARKQLINEMFEIDEGYRSLLNDFADMLLLEIIKMRNETKKLFCSISDSNDRGELTAVGKCLLSPDDDYVWRQDRNMFSMEVWKTQCRYLADTVEDSDNLLVFRCDNYCHADDFASEDLTPSSILDFLLNKQPFTVPDLAYAHDIDSEIHIERVAATESSSEATEQLDWYNDDYSD